MKGYEQDFKGKKITVMGLGLLGRGVGDARFLASSGADVTVTDKKTADELAESVEALRTYPVTLHLGGHRVEDFTDADMVVKAAGVRLDSPEIRAAREAGVRVTMSTALFAAYAMRGGVRVVGVTGTRGKSTVSHMIAHALRRAGKRAHLGGNIRGLSTLSLLPEVRSGDIAVLELDSWQLQGFGDERISPHIAIFTNLMPDHQNYYRSMDEYFADKAHIFAFQKPGDTLIVGAEVERRVRAARPPVEPLVPETIAPDWMLRVPGAHNRHNAALAAAALLALGLNVHDIREGLESFEGVEGRLQFIGRADGIDVYNDNNATTPEATIAALHALDGGRIVLIAGGADKGLDMSEFVDEARARCKAVVLLAGTGTDRIKDALPGAHVCERLADAVDAAFDAAEKGDTVLFSPAFASFGMFKNEYDRNDQFARLVQQRV